MVSKEVAEEEFYRFGEAMDLDFSMDGLDQEDQKGFEGQKRRVCRAIEKGSLVIEEDGTPVFTPQRSGDFPVLRFNEPTAATWIGMDRKKSGQDVGKLYSVIADMVKLPSSQLSKLTGEDAKVVQAIVALFLA